MDECLICRTMTLHHVKAEEEDTPNDFHHGKVRRSKGLSLLDDEIEAYYFLQKLLKLPIDLTANLLRNENEGSFSSSPFLSSSFTLCQPCRIGYLVEGRKIFEEIQALERKHEEVRTSIVARMSVRVKVEEEDEDEVEGMCILPDRPSGRIAKNKGEEVRAYLLNNPKVHDDDGDDEEDMPMIPIVVMPSLFTVNEDEDASGLGRRTRRKMTNRTSYVFEDESGMDDNDLDLMSPHDVVDDDYDVAVGEDVEYKTKNHHVKRRMKTRSRSPKRQPQPPQRTTLFTKWKCYECGEHVPRNELREDHVRKKHMTPEDLLCRGCGESYITVADYVAHIKNDDRKPPCRSSALSCPHRRCAKPSILRGTKEAMEVHRITTHDFRIYDHMNRKVEDPSNCDEESRRSVTCPICHKVVVWKNSLRRHILAHQGHLYKCPRPGCDMSFKQTGQRVSHIRTVHEWEENGRPMLKCSTCGKQFRAKDALRRHEKLHDASPSTHHALQPGTKDNSNFSTSTGKMKSRLKRPLTLTRWKCYVCEEQVPRNETKEDHVRRLHMPKEALTCRGCGALHVLVTDYIAHIKREGANPACLSSALACPLLPCCKMKPQPARGSEEALEVHTKTIHDSHSYDVMNRKVDDLDNCDEERRKSVTCPICHKVVLWKNSLRRHILAHQGHLYKCPRPGCDKSFKQTGQRASHIRTVHEWAEKGRPLMLCPTCGKGFKTKTCLRKHEMLHRPETPYLCTLCGKGFKTKSCLRIHETQHRPETPYLCSLCGKGFKMKSCLRKHEMLHRPETPYLCTLCGKGFKSSSQLRGHMLTHDKDRYKETYDRYKENAKRRKQKMLMATEKPQATPTTPTTEGKSAELDLMSGRL